VAQPPPVSIASVATQLRAERRRLHSPEPAIAWTTWLIPRRDAGEHADPVSYDARLQYQYKIDIEPDDTSDRVFVMLGRGPYHFYERTLPESTRPLLFP
jgi:hypothetical protein